MFQSRHARLTACIAFLAFGGSLTMHATSVNAQEAEGKLLSAAEFKNLLKSEEFSDGSDLKLEIIVKATKVPRAAEPEVGSPPPPLYDLLVDQMYDEGAAWMITERIEECLAMEPRIQVGTAAQLIVETRQSADGFTYDETLGYLEADDYLDADYIAQALRKRCRIGVTVEEHRTRLLATN